MPASCRRGRTWGRIQDQWKPILTYDGATHRYGVVHAGRDRTPQLFDLIDDPHETANLASEHPEIVAWLSERTSRWWPVP